MQEIERELKMNLDHRIIQSQRYVESKLSQEQVDYAVRNIIRAVLSTLSMKKPMSREDIINSYTLDSNQGHQGNNGSRQFAYLFYLAQNQLKRVFGIDLIEASSTGLILSNNNNKESDVGNKQKNTSTNVGTTNYIVYSTLSSDETALLNTYVDTKNLSDLIEKVNNNEANNNISYSELKAASQTKSVLNTDLICILSFVYINHGTITKTKLRKLMNMCNIGCSYVPSSDITERNMVIDGFIKTWIAERYLNRVRKNSKQAVISNADNSVSSLNDNQIFEDDIVLSWGPRAHGEFPVKNVIDFICDVYKPALHGKGQLEQLKKDIQNR